MDPRLRQLLVLSVALILAAWVGTDIATGDLLVPSLAAAVAVGAILVHMLRLPLDAVAVGLVVFGYLVGNRGFAQFMPSPQVPLLPAEAALLVAAPWAVVACAVERRWPWRLDGLQAAALAWLVVGSGRILFDVRMHGFTAIRDYAMVYYATFLFLAIRMAQLPRVAPFLIGCFIAGIVPLAPLNAAFEANPAFFLGNFRLHGTPLLLYKSDLVYTFVAGGAVLLHHWAVGRRRWWAWPLSAALALAVMASDSRASLVGLVAVLAMHAAAGRWRLPAIIGVCGAAGAVLLLALAVLAENPWAERKLDAVSMRVGSIVLPGRHPEDPGTAAYKWDNNRFRLVWWRNVATETWERGPLVGQGFGADLAAGFLREYYPTEADDFNTRSPHNIALTAFGRLGLVGLAVWLALVAAVFRGTWRALRSDDPVGWGLWSVALVAMISAHFGVVLEGPMGAVPFWVALGLAAARGAPPSPSAASLPSTGVPLQDADAPAAT
jgi:hypothetical protein